jgi:hypothetical protein
MGKEYEYVIGAINKLEALAQTLHETPEMIAEEFLRATLIDVPRPPWWTGELRNSGGVYIGNSLHMTTQEIASLHGAWDLLGENPKFSGSAVTGAGLATGRHYGDTSLVPQRFRGSKATYKGSGSYGEFDSFRNKISVIYQAPHAALMHEWGGKFTDEMSGAHYISSKVPSALEEVAVRIRDLNDRRQSGSFSGDFMSDFLDM